MRKLIQFIGVFMCIVTSCYAQEAQDQSTKFKLSEPRPAWSITTVTCSKCKVAFVSYYNAHSTKTLPCSFCQKQCKFVPYRELSQKDRVLVLEELFSQARQYQQNMAFQKHHNSQIDRVVQLIGDTLRFIDPKFIESLAKREEKAKIATYAQNDFSNQENGGGSVIITKERSVYPTYTPSLKSSSFVPSLTQIGGKIIGKPQITEDDIAIHATKKYGIMWRNIMSYGEKMQLKMELEHEATTRSFAPLPTIQPSTNQSSTAATYSHRRLFLGKELDFETNTYQLGDRLYDPLLGVFYSVDPLAHKSPSMSPYSYSFDNPNRYKDPTGRFPWDLLDFAALALSAYDFYKDPTLANAGWLALDAVGAALPIVPSTWVFRHGARLLAGTPEALEIIKGAEKLEEVGSSIKRITTTSDMSADAISAFKKIDNSVSKNLKASDISGALKESNGMQIIDKATGKVFDHRTEVKNAVKSLDLLRS